MKKNLTYSEAFAKLEALTGELEDGNIPLDKLTEKVKQARELIAVCEAALRKTEDGVNGEINSTASA